MKRRLLKFVQVGVLISVLIHMIIYPISELKAAPRAGKSVKIGDISSLQRDASERPNGAIYGQAQMNYVFKLTRGSKTIQMGRGGNSGIGYMNTAQGSVYCMDPEKLACRSVGEGARDDYYVENYQEANSEKIGLIWYYGNVKHANDVNFMDYVALTQIMLWEELGWSAKIEDGFSEYERLKSEVEKQILQHKKTLQWEIIDTNEQDSSKFQLNEGNWDLKLEPGKYVVLNDKSGRFNNYFAHWDTIPSGIKVERVGMDSIKFTALNGYSNNATLQYSEVEPEMIGGAYLLKPNAQAGSDECQTLIMPYVNESVSNMVKFHISSEIGDTEKEDIEISYPEFIKVDQENNFPLQGATFAFYAAEAIKESFEIDREVCRIDSESGDEICEIFTSNKTATIWGNGKEIARLQSDANGEVDLSCFESLYDEQVAVVATELQQEAENIVSVEALGSFLGGRFAYQELQTSGVRGTNFGYYNQNRNKKITFIIDSNSGGRRIVEKNKRQKGKIVFRKVDGDDYYLNHHVKEIPQGDGKFNQAVFHLYAREDVVLPNGKILYKAGDLVEEITTNEQGIGESSLLELGKYWVEEVILPEGYWFYDYLEKGQEVDIDISYSTQDKSVRIFTFNENEIGEMSPFEEVEIEILDENDVRRSLNYKNSIQKGHIEIAKHYEGPIDDHMGGSANKQPIEGIYFGIYLNSKLGNEYQTNLPDEYFKSLQLNGSLKVNRPPFGEKEVTYDLVHERSLYMVLRTNELGIASSKDPKSIVWANLAKLNAENTEIFTSGLALPYGEYTVEELNTPQGYVPSSFQLKIDRVDGQLSTIRTNKFEYVFANKIIQN